METCHLTEMHLTKKQYILPKNGIPLEKVYFTDSSLPCGNYLILYLVLLVPAPQLVAALQASGKEVGGVAD